jgi:hypothetical protein
MSQENMEIERPSGLRSILIGALYSAGRLRVLAEPLIGEAVFRRAFPHTLMRGYEDFNRRSTIPHANFAENFELHQTAAMLGTVGTFHGPGALDEVIAELHEGFENVRFSPEVIRRVDGCRLVVVVRFIAKGRASGVQVDHNIAHVWTREGVQAKRLEVYWEPREALEAVGLRASDADESIET